VLIILREIAEDVATTPTEKTDLIDAFAGAGGDTIQFALSSRGPRACGVRLLLPNNGNDTRC